VYSSITVLLALVVLVDDKLKPSFLVCLFVCVYVCTLFLTVFV